MGSTRAVLAAVLIVGASGAAFARGGGGGSSGDGLSPYSALSGNDRSAGVNNGNYQDPRYNAYIRAYPPRGYGPAYFNAPVPPGYYGPGYYGGRYYGYPY